MHNLAQILMSNAETDQTEQALGMMDECVRLRAKTLGVDHANTKQGAAILEEWQQQMAILRSLADGVASISLVEDSGKKEL